MNLQWFQALNVNLTFEIFLLYHIRKFVDKNYICLVLVLYMCTLEQLKGPLNYKRLLHTCVLYNFDINLYANLGVSSLTCKYL